jgi:hypothetical protein
MIVTQKHLAYVLDLLICRPLLTRADLARRYNCNLDTISRRWRQKRLPRPRIIDGRFPMWCPCEIEAFDRRETARKGKRK